MLNKIGNVVGKIVIEVIIIVTSLTMFYGVIQVGNHIAYLERENEMLKEELLQIERGFEELEEILNIED